MADTITLIAQDEEGRRIVEAFAEETGLDAEDDGEGRHVFAVEGDEHEIEVVQTLDGIDADWNEHIALEDPA